MGRGVASWLCLVALAGCAARPGPGPRTAASADFEGETADALADPRAPPAQVVLAAPAAAAPSRRRPPRCAVDILPAHRTSRAVEVVPEFLIPDAAATAVASQQTARFDGGRRHIAEIFRRVTLSRIEALGDVFAMYWSAADTPELEVLALLHVADAADTFGGNVAAFRLALPTDGIEGEAELEAWMLALACQVHCVAYVDYQRLEGEPGAIGARAAAQIADYGPEFGATCLHD